MTVDPAGVSRDEAHRVLRGAVEAAVMAPSSHNTQPWRFRIVDTCLEIHADLRRQLPVIDRERRQLIQSCGCALFNARVAIRASGYTDELTVMRDGADPTLLATIHLGARIISSDLDLSLAHAIPRRRTNRRRFLPRPVSRAETDLLIATAAQHDVWADRLHPDQKARLAHLIDEADRLQFGDPAFRHELASWLAPIASRRRDGIPFVEKEYGSAMPFAVMRALRSPHIGERVGSLEDELVQSAPVVLVLGTTGDNASDWLACGQGLEALLLHATERGLSAAFLNQVLELPELRGRVAELLDREGYPQMVLRLGYPEEPIHHPAPRREIDDVLLVVS